MHDQHGDLIIYDYLCEVELVYLTESIYKEPVSKRGRCVRRWTAKCFVRIKNVMQCAVMWYSGHVIVMPQQKIDGVARNIN